MVSVKPKFGGWLVVGVLPLFLTPSLAQEKPLSLSGVFSTGFYSTRNENSFDSTVSTIPVGVQFDLSGYLTRPDFLNFRLQPQLSNGPQTYDAGFTNGNGITASATFLSRRSFPLTISYSNIFREQLTYGSLTRISGLRSTNHARSFNLNWQLRAPRLPVISFGFGRTRDDLEPHDPIIPDAHSRSRNYGVTVQDTRWGWHLDGSLRWNKSSSDFANPLVPDLITTSLAQRDSHYQATARRSLWRQSELTLNAGLLKNRSTYNDLPFRQDASFANGLLTMGRGKRWNGNVRVSYNSNLLGAEILRGLSQPASGLTSAAVIPSTPTGTPFETRVNSLSVSGNARYQVHRDWTLVGSLSRDRVTTPNGGIASAESNSLNSAAGVMFNRTFSWATITTQYTLNVGTLDYANIPDSGMLGHSFSLHAQHGSVEKLEWAGSFTLSTQRVDQLTALRTHNRTAELSVGRRFYGLIFRGGFGVQQSAFRDGGVDYDSDGLTFRASLEHPRLQLHYFRNVVDANSLQALAAGGGSASATLRIIPSSFRTQTLNLRAAPWRRVELQFLWTRGHQELDRRLSNDYDQFDVQVGYSFRLLKFQLGYARHDQSFLTLPGYMRSRFYLRISRPFRVF
jgi:hypothetical protein